MATLVSTPFGRWKTCPAGHGKKRVNQKCVVRHLMKCRRGDNCPLLFCHCTYVCPATGEAKNKEQIIQNFTSSKFYMHYAKCREGLRGPTGPMYNNCPLCETIRADMKWLKEKYFNESPIPLQLLAACAVPKDQIMDPHLHREELLRMKYSAARIQRRWRKFLYSRGPHFRTSLCSDYMSGRGCRNGVNCTFAHGNHDLRHSFRPKGFMGALRVSLGEILSEISSKFGNDQE
jgi:hypothetical protein